MIRRLFILLATALLPVVAASLPSSLEPGILKELNQLRANPGGFVGILRQQRQYYHGNLLTIPGQPDLITQEGVRPLDEAIAVLQSTHAHLGSLTLSSGLSRAAADHVLDNGRLGLVGHTSADGTDFSKRIARYGAWSGDIGEAITYGAHQAREVVVDLLIDDGVASRGHRKTLLDPRWHDVGIACGPHAHYGTMCVIDFASTYQDR